MGDGQNINFWKDWRVGGKPLLQQLNPQTNIDTEVKVANFIGTDGSWNLQSTGMILPPNIVQEILFTPLPQFSQQLDSISLGKAANDKFSSKNFYNLLTDNTFFTVVDKKW